jgi:hypothetical protein
LFKVGFKRTFKGNKEITKTKIMKQVLMSQLMKGDVFTDKVQLHGRKAYEVVETPEAGSKTIKCRERGCIETTKKQKKGYVVLLRNVHGNVQNQTV